MGHRSRINEADARTRPISALQIGKPRDHYGWDQSHKARITDQMRKLADEMDLNVFGVIGFERPRVRLVKMDENRHHLTWAELAWTLPLFSGFQSAHFPLWCKAKPKIIDITKQWQSNSLLDPSGDR